MKFSKKAIIFGIVTWPICFIFISLIMSGAIVSAYYGFAVDNNGFLYVGKNSRIDVYDNGVFVKTVYETSYGYSFTIKNENLYIATESQVKVMDLSGTLIETTDDSVWPTEQYRMDRDKSVFLTNNARYVATDILGFYKITRYNNNGTREIVYHIPVIDYAVHCAILFITIVSFVIFIRTHKKWLQDEKEKKKKMQ